MAAEGNGSTFKSAARNGLTPHGTETASIAEVIVIPKGIGFDLWFDDISHREDCMPNSRQIRLRFTGEPKFVPSSIPYADPHAKPDEVFEHALRAHCDTCGNNGQNQLEEMPFRTNSNFEVSIDKARRLILRAFLQDKIEWQEMNSRAKNPQ